MILRKQQLQQTFADENSQYFNLRLGPETPSSAADSGGTSEQHQPIKKLIAQ